MKKTGSDGPSVRGDPARPKAKSPRGPRRAVGGATRPSGPASERIQPLRYGILDAAMNVVELHGLPALTTRRLGRVLGCEAMSIYHHFPSKRHLLDAMVERAIAGVREPPESLDPLERLRFLGGEYRAMAHRYPRLFPLLALHRLNMPAGVAFIQGNGPRAARRRLRAAVPRAWLQLVGAALDETSGYAKARRRPIPSTTNLRANAAPCAAAPYFKRPYFDATFDLGFGPMLDGIAERSRRSTVAASPKPVVRLKA